MARRHRLIGVVIIAVEESLRAHRKFRLKRAFTLTELLVAVAIVALLSVVLFPVLASAKAAANKVACVSNFHQVTLATSLYLADYEDRFPPVSHDPASVHDASKDRTWVQLLLPYTNSFQVFQCPADHGARRRPDGVFDVDVTPGDTYSRYYEASLRSDIGFNYLYLSPMIKDRYGWTAQPRNTSQIAEHTATILFTDSVWARTSDGRPVGGGNYLVVPPCRYEQVGDRVVDTFQAPSGRIQFFTTSEGWQEEPTSAYVFGGAWPWHSGKMNVARVDGSVRSMTPDQMSAGCDQQPGWQGYINDRDAYLWDLR